MTRFQDRNAFIEKFAAKKPSTSDFELKFSKYTRIQQELQARDEDRKNGIFRINCRGVIEGISAEVREWMLAIGSVMSEQDSTIVEGLHSEIDSIQVLVNTDPCNLDALKQVVLKVTLESVNDLARMPNGEGEEKKQARLIALVAFFRPFLQEQVLNAISVTNTRNMTMEIDYMNIEERYNMRKYYNLPFTEEEFKRAIDIRHKW